MFSSLSIASFSPQSSLTASNVTGCFSKREERLSMAEAANPFSVSSFLTPSSPILSSLSNVMHTLASSSSANPVFVRIVFKRPLSFIFTLKFLSPMLKRALVVVFINSISQFSDELPRMSISHCTNSRRRPF